MANTIKYRLAIAMVGCLTLGWVASVAQAAEPFANDPQYLAACAQFANGHFREAAPRLVELLGRYPQHARLQIMAADAYERSNQLVSARDLYRAALGSKPDAKAEAIATEAVARLTRQIEQPAAATTAPATAGASAGFDLRPEQVAAMSVIYPAQSQRKTEHFDITTNNPTLADILAQRVEAVFERVGRVVPGEQLFPHRVEMTVYPDLARFRKAQAVAEWSGGGFVFAPKPDGTIRRAVLLYQVDEQNRFRTALLTRELPHELTHVVIKEYFGQTPCPAWLDEGLACMAEADGGKAQADRMADLLSGHLATPLAEMLDMVKIDNARPAAFYAQAVSWTRFLRSSLTDAQMKSFLTQLKAGQYLYLKPSVVLGRVLVVDDQPGWLGAMEERWHKWVREPR